MESTQPLQTTIHHFKTTTEYPDSPQRQFSVLTEDGIIQYTKQRPVNQFEHILHSGNSSALLEFKKRYRAEETVCFGYALACTNQLSEAIQFVHMSSAKEEGLLLYFARIVNGIWNMDLKQERYKILGENRWIALTISLVFLKKSCSLLKLSFEP
jgi:hypothetical protein